MTDYQYKYIKYKSKYRELLKGGYTQEIDELERQKDIVQKSKLEYNKNKLMEIYDKVIKLEKDKKKIL